MPGCRIERETEGDHVVIRVSGTFDSASASELRDWVSRERDGELVLDFSHVRDFADLGVAALARGLSDGDRRLRFRGLRQHQLRIFRYFGWDLDGRRAAPARR